MNDDSVLTTIRDIEDDSVTEELTGRQSYSDTESEIPLLKTKEVYSPDSFMSVGSGSSAYELSHYESELDIEPRISK